MLRTLVASLLALLVGSTAWAQDEGKRFHFSRDAVEVRELLQACSYLLGVPIDFDPEAVKGQVAIGALAGLPIEAVWDLVNRRLAERSLACIQLPGQEALTVVAMDKAPGLARLEYGDLDESKAGFVKVLYGVRHAAPNELASALSQLLPKDGSVAANLSGSDHMLLAGLRPQVEEALAALGFLDSGPESVRVEEIQPEHVPAATLGAQLEQLTQRRKSAGAEEMRGGVVASSSGSTLLLVAPISEMPQWREWVEQFDRAQPVVTRGYVPRRFGLEETAKLEDRRSKGMRPRATRRR